MRETRLREAGREGNRPRGELTKKTGSRETRLRKTRFRETRSKEAW